MTWTMEDQRTLEAAIKRLRGVLSDQMSRRATRNGVVDDGHGGRELAWVNIERHALHNETNRIRSEAGLSYLPLHEIERVERSATGHCDYFEKFTLYCAELAVRDL